MQRLLSLVPGGGQFNYLLQRYVTRSAPLDDAGFAFRARLAQDILGQVREWSRDSGASTAYYEFGAGSDLIGPIAFYAMGVERQIVVDRSALIRRALVLDTLEKSNRLGPGLGFARLPRRDLPGSQRDLRHALRRQFGIDYLAPLDARATGLPAGSVDVVTSNSTLEHVPPDELTDLLTECLRIVRPGGLMCMRIDYEDHYAYIDPGLSPFNFLYFSEEEWARYNPPLHYQNRLRHGDYLELFARLGIEVLTELRLEAGQATLAQLDTSRLDARFRGYDLADLAVRKCTFVLRRAP